MEKAINIFQDFFSSGDNDWSKNAISLKEIWKDVKGYEGIYQVSNLGRVKSLKFGKERILKGGIDGVGYLTVSLSKNGKVKTHKVHVLVAIAFLGHTPCGYKLVVDHKNFIRHDCRLENLEIITQRENANLKHIKSTSEYVGVSWDKGTKKWRADIHVNGKHKYLGLFTDELEASNAYQNALNNLK